ncbi:hypothetical protein FJZ31_33855 [Candidatus Poribacteria bacterium]|nr:hypothetical protein [Candidatus Poribacteria bacterium]
MVTEVKIEFDTEFIEQLDKLAQSEFKTRESVIKSALAAYIERYTKMVDIKRLATGKFLNGDLDFDDFARIVGYDNAILARDIDQAMKESIVDAKKDFAF